ncbi:C4-dicarboxylate ABC transporter substrate-binding protein [Cognatiyoonia sp. IB215182]|uniref:C4-dicarboxylate ABC transporter substrate-binding protein n=1 Tax=Cognatiyoonia sp. IB215182 TaxID=3097353 RepID=UPI002A0C632E|nr:C4-dicarboxylate ABC transporter substrate-binding protein [Cognatiyoonia sp. IB215182]MDX8351611.1 C4-dicarboxylate ABC transporter substrate-binding protein [Cognatiyoonia sp. IB215182]
MFTFVRHARQSIKSGLCVSLTALCLPGLVAAQEITLQTADGNTISGELVEFNNGNYVIDSILGRLNVRADQVECFGDACPDLNAGPVVWNVSLWGQRRAFTEHLEKLAELVDEKTEGDFTLNLVYGGELSPSVENLDGISQGRFEMAQFCAGYNPEKNPSLNVLELPFLGVSTLEQEVAVSVAVYEHPYTIADMARWNATLLMPSPQPQQNLLGSGQPPTSLADFARMTIRAPGGIGDAVESLGATAVTLPAPAVADALRSGEIAAVSFAPHAHMAFGVIESGSWWTTNLNPGTTNCPVVMNTPAFEALSDEHREALMSSVEPALEHYVDHYTNVTMQAWFPALEDRSIIQLTFGDEIKSRINSLVAAPSAARWIAENSVEGVPAQELYNLVVQTVAQNF